MKYFLIVFFFFSIELNAIGQVIIGPKGTKLTIDSSKWKLQGNDMFNKNIGKIGIGTSTPTAQLHTTSNVRFEGIGTNTIDSKILTSDALGNITTRTISNLLSSNALTSLNGLTISIQTFSIGNTGTDFNISSAGSNHTFNIPSASSANRGILTSVDWTNFNNKENALTFSTGLTRTGNTITVNGVTNAMLSQVPSPIFKGRSSAGTGNVEDLTTAQATAMLSAFTATTQGVVPASGGGTNTFLRADGVFASTGTANRTLVILSNDVTNNNATGNTLQDVTGLSFNVTAGTTYRFYAMIPYTSDQASNGSRWTINGPATTFIGYVSRYADNPEAINYCGAINLPTGCSNLSNLSGNVAIIQGVIKPSANGIVQVRFSSELGGVGITAKAGASIEYW